MVRKNLLLLALLAAAPLFFGGCATTTLSSLKTVQDEFGTINRADGIKYAPTEYAQAETNVFMADEECAEEGWLDLKECEKYQGVAKARMEEVRKKIAEGQKPAPKKAEAVPEPVPPPVTPPVAPPSAASAPAPIEGAVVAVKEAMRVVVHFDFDRSHIRKDGVKALKEVINYIKANPDANIKIEGHTCNIGTNAYNLGLSDRRANSVQRYLVKKTGIDPARIEVIGYGEEKPARSNDTLQGRRYNRRAEVIIIK